MEEETIEEYFLSSIKNVLQFGNDAQAIRFMEKYFEAKQKDEIKMEKSLRGQELEAHLEGYILENLFETPDSISRYLSDSLDKTFDFPIKVLGLTKTETGHYIKLYYQDENGVDRVMDITITSNTAD
jgi:uncharacterized glyoxalase superfamily protein PhnB